ncbi:hypothetical protein L0F63_005052 [Massospora cicadina]|nr:hypothetical protein L0F63_005052 [Massospora cicadina]
MIHGNTTKPSTGKACYSEGVLTPEVSSVGCRNANGIPLKQPGQGVVDRLQPQDTFLSPNNTSPETSDGSALNRNQSVIEQNNQNMVPMSMLLKRHLGKALAERRALLDVLPTLRRTERKKHILAFVTNNKKRIQTQCPHKMGA